MHIVIVRLSSNSILNTKAIANHKRLVIFVVKTYSKTYFFYVFGAHGDVLFGKQRRRGAVRDTIGMDIFTGLNFTH